MALAEYRRGLDGNRFGTLLREHRLERGLTQASLAERAGISRRALQDLERGVRQPHRDTIERLISGLNVAPQEQDAMRRAASATPRQRTIRFTEPGPVDSGQHRQHTVPGAPRSSHDPLFVGRERELQQLRVAFDACSAGHGSVVMLVGDPGIGKTALCEEFAFFAATRNALVLNGHCYQEGFGLPYQAFVEAFANYTRDRDATALRSEFGPRVVELARLVPMLRERLELQLPPPVNASEDRFRLMQGVVECLHGLAKGQPLVLVLEDLHDADRGTLDLLLHLARSLETGRILVIGTYRDVELDHSHPLSSALAELRRSRIFLRMQLHGLSVDEVHHLMCGASNRSLSRAVATVVHARTDGNALFVHELLRSILEGLSLGEHDGRLRTVRHASLQHIPEGLREVVSRRLSRMSPGTNQTLSIAAVIGREFDLEILRSLRSASPDELEKELEEAVAARILEERSAVGNRITYRFRHAFFRQVLYDEMLAPRRVRLHRDVAVALERMYGPKVARHAAELAEHFSYASDDADLARAVHFAILAAGRASEVFAYAEAARQLQRALEVQDLIDSGDDLRRCDILLALGEALSPLGETQYVITTVAPEAFRLAERIGDRSRAFRATRQVLESLSEQGAGTSTGRADHAIWAERAVAHASPDSAEEAYANLALADAVFVRGQADKAYQLRIEALELAQKHQDRETQFKAAFELLLNSPPQRWSARFRIAEEAVQWSREGVSAHRQSALLFYAGSLELARGERVRGEALWSQIDALAERTRTATPVLYSLQWKAVTAILDGRLNEALARIEEFALKAEELGASARGRHFSLLLLLRPLVYLGRANEWLKALHHFGPIDGSAAIAKRLLPYHAACLAHLGRLDEARLLVAQQLDDEAANRGDPERNANLLVLLFETAVLVGHRLAAAAISKRLECLADTSMGDWFYTCIGRHLGAAAVLIGNCADARRYFVRALQAANRIGFRPEQALTHLALAELLLQEGGEANRSQAQGHLDLAITELREMDMQPGLRRALEVTSAATQSCA